MSSMPGPRSHLRRIALGVALALAFLLLIRYEPELLLRSDRLPLWAKRAVLELRRGLAESTGSHESLYRFLREAREERERLALQSGLGAELAAAAGQPGAPAAGQPGAPAAGQPGAAAAMAPGAASGAYPAASGGSGGTLPGAAAAGAANAYPAASGGSSGGSAGDAALAAALAAALTVPAAHAAVYRGGGALPAAEPAPRSAEPERLAAAAPHRTAAPGDDAARPPEREPARVPAAAHPAARTSAGRAARKPARAAPAGAHSTARPTGRPGAGASRRAAAPQRSAARSADPPAAQLTELELALRASRIRAERFDDPLGAIERLWWTEERAKALLQRYPDSPRLKEAIVLARTYRSRLPPTPPPPTLRELRDATLAAAFLLRRGDRDLARERAAWAAACADHLARRYLETDDLRWWRERAHSLLDRAGPAGSRATGVRLDGDKRPCM